MNGLYVHRSNRLEALTTLLGEQLRHTRAGPLDAVSVVVGSRGMERHLRHALAEQIGVCALLEFPFPNAALDALCDGPGQADPWAPGTMVWSLLEVLPAVASTPDGEALRHYLGGDPPETVDAQTWGFARALADLFDRYVTYRPDWTSSWDGEGPVEPATMPSWQLALWRTHRDRVRGRPHLAERLATLGALLPSEHPLHVFGLSSIPPSWLEALVRVARTRPVELYLLSPSHLFWGDVRRRIAVDDAARVEDSPLLAAWGRTGRDLQLLLESLPEEAETQRTDIFIEPFGATGPGRGPSALHRLQHDLLHARIAAPPSSGLSGIDPDDRSVQFHACHGAMRQVEVLRTVLLELLEADPTLHPRDIVVMTPDIDGYAPRIAAVFDRGQRTPGGQRRLPVGTPRIPWELADIAVRRINPVAEALLRVLDLVQGRTRASEVLDLLALEPVAERFRMGRDDLAVIRDWVVESGIRWGADEGERAREELPADLQNTWRFGLERLLMGVLMGDEAGLTLGTLPLATEEGAATHLVGRFAHFCGTLFEQIERLRAPRTLSAWCEQLHHCVRALTTTSGTAAWLTRRARQTLDTLAAEADAAGSERPVEVAAVQLALTRRFEVASTAHHGSGNGVVFCGMVPERAVPYRVVCWLGMDEGSFPRTGARPTFDLLQRHPRLGDRELRDEDRYLLLEALLSARDHLVVLYAGRDVRSNESLPPAAPISELFDAIDATWPDPHGGATHRRLVREHPLQPFDPEDFGSEGPSWSYDARMVEGARATLSPREKAPPMVSPSALTLAMDGERCESLDLEALVRFWRFPLRTWMQRRLGIFLDHDSSYEVPDREPLELVSWEQGRLLEAILASRRAGQDVASLREVLAARGELPLGAAGRRELDEMVQVADAVEREVGAVVGWSISDETTIDVDLSLSGTRLSGRVAGGAPGALVRVHPGTERASALLDAWLELLARKLTVPEEPARAVLAFASMGPRVQLIGLDAGDIDAELALGFLVASAQAGMRTPLPFFPKVSHVVAKELQAKLPDDWKDPERLATDDLFDVSDVLEAARLGADREWVGGWHGGEGDDRYHRHAFGDHRPYLAPDGSLAREVVVLAARCWWPILRARRTSRHVRAWSKA